jgi:integrase
LRELREERRSYFGHLTYHLAVALFFTGCRFHEWARLTFDRLVHEPGGVIIAARLQLKGGSFRDLPLTKELSDSLEEWFEFLESVKGVRLRGGGVDFAGSPLIFPGRDGAPFSNQAFNARIKLACKRARVPVISAHLPDVGLKQWGDGSKAGVVDEHGDARIVLQLCFHFREIRLVVEVRHDGSDMPSARA